MHMCALRCGKHYNNHLQRAWDLYGEENFDAAVLELCDIDRLDDREIYYIDKYNSFKEGYNQTVGGGGIRGVVFSEESKKKMRESHRDVSYEKHPQAKKIVLVNTGEIFDCINLAAEKYNIAHADISKCAKGKSRSAGSYNCKRLVWAYYDTYRKMSEDEIYNTLFLAENWRKGGMCYKARKVICTQTNRIFDTISDAANYYGVSNCTMSDACRTRHKIKKKECNNLTFWFYDEYLRKANGETSCVNNVS